MLNLTARLAISIRTLPEWDVDWSDTSPQRHPQTLTISDILPSCEDAAELEKHAVDFIKKFLVAEFSDLKHFQAELVQDEGHPTEKSVVVPMKILFKDEKYKAQTIDILSQLIADAQLPGNPEVRVLCNAGSYIQFNLLPKGCHW